MINPRLIEVVRESATYKIPTYKVTNDGIEDGSGLELKLCKGNKLDENVFRQEGVFSESLIELVVQYLTSVNKGELATKETSVAITHLETALLWLNKRTVDRAAKGTLGTYNK